MRAAIQEANAFLGTDRINFNISGTNPHTIVPLTALPIISEAVIIDGTTQPGYAGVPLIELNGASAGPSSSGLVITAGNSTVRGMTINRFGNSGINLQTNGGNNIQGNLIGTDVTGSVDLGNAAAGIRVSLGSANNVIGGTNPSERNVISGNNANGIEIVGTGSPLGQVSDIFAGSGGSAPYYVTVFNNALYFAADGNDGAGRELWRYNGATTRMVAHYGGMTEQRRHGLRLCRLFHRRCI
jgi:hypothetical protein